MKTTIKILSITAIILGGLALLGAATDLTSADAGYGLIGGAFILALGILNLVYIKQTAKIQNNDYIPPQMPDIRSGQTL